MLRAIKVSDPSMIQFVLHTPQSEKSTGMMFRVVSGKFSTSIKYGTRGHINGELLFLA